MSEQQYLTRTHRRALRALAERGPMKWYWAENDRSVVPVVLFMPRDDHYRPSGPTLDALVERGLATVDVCHSRPGFSFKDHSHRRYEITDAGRALVEPQVKSGQSSERALP